MPSPSPLPGSTHIEPTIGDRLARIRRPHSTCCAAGYATATGLTTPTTTLAALPGLLVDVRANAAAAADVDRAAAYTLLARAQHLTGNLLIQLRAGDLAQTALSGALAAARESGNVVVSGTVIQGMCWLLMRQGQLVEAAELAVSTADRIEPRFPKAAPGDLAAWGAISGRQEGPAVGT